MSHSSGGNIIETTAVKRETELRYRCRSSQSTCVLRRAAQRRLSTCARPIIVDASGCPLPFPVLSRPTLTPPCPHSGVGGGATHHPPPTTPLQNPSWPVVGKAKMNGSANVCCAATVSGCGAGHMSQQWKIIVIGSPSQQLALYG